MVTSKSQGGQIQKVQVNNYTMAIHIKEDNGRRVTVGQVFNGAFYKRVKKSKHLLKVTDSWGIDAELMKLLEIECNAIKILDEDEDIMYQCTVYDYVTKGDYKHFKPHRAQMFLSRKYFEKIEHYMHNKNKQDLKTK